MKPLIPIFLLMYLLIAPPLGAQAPVLGQSTPVVDPVSDDVPPTPPPPATATPGPVDGYEPDDLPRLAKRLVQGEVQVRTFYSPHGRDVEWVVVHLKPGHWRIAARTTTGIYDPRLQLGEIIADDEEGKNALLDVTIAEEGDRLLKVDNLGQDGPGEYTLSLEPLAPPASPTVGATYTPHPTYTPQPLPTATPYPTYTPVPSPTATAVTLPTATSYPTPLPYVPIPTTPAQVLVYTPPSATGDSAVPSGSTRPAESSTSTAGTDRGPSSALAVPQPPLAALTLEVFLDVNRDGLMNRGEETENVLVVATVPSRSWETEAYVTRGEVALDLTGLPADEELILLVPYLHQSARIRPEGGELRSEIALDLPTYPAYLP